jgi:hypothetical protein
VAAQAPVLFLNGACGNVNPAWSEQTFDEAERVGSIVGAEAARRLQELRPLGGHHRAWNIRWDELTDRAITTGDLVAEPRISVAARNVGVPLRVLDAPPAYADELRRLVGEHASLPPADLEARRALMERITYLQGTRGVAADLRGPRMLHPEVQAIGLGGGVAVLGLPGEFFAETGMAIRAAAGARWPMISCYTNHHVMYVVPRDAWPQGGYEPGVAILDESAEETFRAAGIELLDAVS